MLASDCFKRKDEVDPNAGNISRMLSLDCSVGYL